MDLRTLTRNEFAEKSLTTGNPDFIEIATRFASIDVLEHKIRNAVLSGLITEEFALELTSELIAITNAIALTLGKYAPRTPKENLLKTAFLFHVVAQALADNTELIKDIPTSTPPPVN